MWKLYDGTTTSPQNVIITWDNDTESTSNSLDDGFIPWAWKENDDEYVLSHPAPGADKKDFSVKFVNGELQLIFEGNDYSSPFNKSYQMPDGVSSKDITSMYEAGVLTIVVKKPYVDEKKINVM